MKRKIPGILLVTVICFTLLAGCGGNSEVVSTDSSSIADTAQTDAKDTGAKAGPLFDKPVTLRLLIGGSASWPLQKDWYVLNAIKEKTNVSFDIISVTDEGDNMTNKINLMMASKDVPELTFNFDRSLFQRYGAEGAYANLLEYQDKMPDFTEWMKQNESFAGDFKSADGRLFIAPDQGIQETDRRGWLYRKDIFEKNGLKLPTNENEFYDVLKKLKELYPDSYPFTFRGQLNKFEYLSASWGTSFTGDHELYYDYNGKAWKFGGIEDNFKEVLVFYNKLYNEKLVPPDYLSLDTKGWQDIMTTSKAFVTNDYLGRIDFFNKAARTENPDFTLAFLPPFKCGSNGVAMNAYSANASSGFAVAADSDKLDTALKYMDWMYTSEAKELLSWGEEGKTYNVADGKKKFIGVEDVPGMRKQYGLSTSGMYALFDYDAHVSLFSTELSAAITEARKYDLQPVPYVTFTEEEQNEMSQKYDIIKKYVQDNVSQFLLGTRPLTEWDAYVKEVRDLGIEDIIGYYTKAYQRQNASK